MSHSNSVQGVTQASVLGQLPGEVVDQVIRRLREYAEQEYVYEMTEDVFSRGNHEAGSAVPEEDLLRVRHTSLDGVAEWSITSLARPLPVREYPEVLIRGISMTPVLEGDARSFAVALGYFDRRFATKRKGTLFTLHEGLTSVQIFQMYDAAEAALPVDSLWHAVEVTSRTSQKPLVGTSTPVQVLRDRAIARTLSIKRNLKGLVDLSRAE